MKKIIAFDLDDTLCSRPDNIEHFGKEKYKHCYPLQPMIDKLNEMYDLGFTIYIYTARGMSIFNGNVEEIYENLYELTLSQLNDWGVQHNGLIMGKIHYDLLVDDKAMNLETAYAQLNKLKDE